MNRKFGILLFFIIENALLLGLCYYFMVAKEERCEPCPVCPVINKPEIKTPPVVKTPGQPKLTKKPVQKKPWKKVISFGLYGADPKYTVGTIQNCNLAKTIYPGWICKIYYDKTVPTDIIKQLNAMNNTETMEITNPKLLKGGIRGMFWRFLTFEFDPEVEIMIVRDSDSRLSIREKEAVDAWLQSGKGFHIMRDNPYHGIPILGGTWGAKRGAIPVMLPEIEKYPKDTWQQDQNFLQGVIWPKVKDNQVSHDAYTCMSFPNSRPFPSPRVGKVHVGSVCDISGHCGMVGDKGAYISPPPCRPIPEAKFG
eukprot:gene5290-8908_t